MVALKLLRCIPTLQKSLSATGKPSSVQIRELSPEAQTKWSLLRHGGGTDLAEDRVAPRGGLAAESVTLLPLRNVADYRFLSKSREALHRAEASVMHPYTPEEHVSCWRSF